MSITPSSASPASGIGSLSPTPKRTPRAARDGDNASAIADFVDARSGSDDLADELLRTVMGSRVSDLGGGLFKVYDLPSISTHCNRSSSLRSIVQKMVAAGQIMMS